MAKKSLYVRDLTPGMSVDETFLLTAANLGQSRNGPYWSLTLQDATGSVDGKIWSPRSLDYPSLDPGRLCRIQGGVENFRDRTQLRVDGLTPLDDDAAVNLSDFLPTSRVPPEELLEAVEDLVAQHMKYAPWKSLCRKILGDEEVRRRLLTAPGAKTVHHAYVGGLLEHTLQVARTCMALCDVYPYLDRQVLLAGAIFHDLGKAWELTGGATNEYTDQGRLLGHIELSAEILEPFLNRCKSLEPGLKLHLKHLILSHHGEHEFGSPVRPKTPEAFVLHFADNMDAKLNIIGRAFEEMDQTGQTWSPYLRYLERNVFRAPATPDPAKKKNDKSENQCLLPLKA